MHAHSILILHCTIIAASSNYIYIYIYIRCDVTSQLRFRSLFISGPYNYMDVSWAVKDGSTSSTTRADQQHPN